MRARDAAFVREEDESFRLDEEERFLGVEVGLGPDGVAKLGEMASSRADNLRDGVARAPDGDGERVGTRAEGGGPRGDEIAKAGRLAGMSRERVGGGVRIEDRRLGDVADAVHAYRLGSAATEQVRGVRRGRGRFRGGSIAGRTSAALLRTVAVAEATRVSGRQGPRWRAARHRPEIVQPRKSACLASSDPL